jgi:HD-GYP domain-containing protein (c-di-GMP phosphodiesterase class II)
MRGRQSLLFTDPDVAASLQSESALRGELGSVICAVLRTPDGEVGVFHLDRARGEEPFTAADLYLADTVAAAIALGLDRPQLVARHQTTLLQSLASLASAIGVRDGYTDSHTRRLIELARLLGEELGLSAEQRRQLQVATALHDVGMIAVEDYILFKPSKLQPNELEQMKAHVTRGVEIVRSVPGLEWAVPVVRGHHEQWDGTGYPDGLAGDEIPLASRILAVVDAFESLTSDRPYRKGVSVTRALGELQTGAGSHFDPNCVAAFLRIRPRIEEVLARDTAEEA